MDNNNLSTDTKEYDDIVVANGIYFWFNKGL